MFKKLAALVLPPWVGPALLAAAAASLYLLGMMHGVRTEGQKHIDYLATQANRTVRVSEKQIQVVHDVQIVYRDRITTITKTGEQIATAAPQLVTADDSLHFGVNAGFVRIYNAAWTNSPADVAGAAADSDREPAAVSLTDIAETEAHNATACHAWREQAIGLRSLYEGMRAITDAAAREDQ